MFCTFYLTGEAFFTLYHEFFSGFASFKICISAQHACIPVESCLIPLYPPNVAPRNTQSIPRSLNGGNTKISFLLLMEKNSCTILKKEDTKKNQASPLFFGFYPFFLLYSIRAD